MTATTTTTLSAPGVGTLAITTPAINAGTASLPVYGLAPAAAPGVFLTATPNFIGRWLLTRHTSGAQGDIPVSQVVAQGDQLSLLGSGAGPFATLTATDLLTLSVTTCSAGSITMSVVQ